MAEVVVLDNLQASREDGRERLSLYDDSCDGCAICRILRSCVAARSSRSSWAPLLIGCASTGAVPGNVSLPGRRRKTAPTPPASTLRRLGLGGGGLPPGNPGREEARSRNVPRSRLIAQTDTDSSLRWCRLKSERRSRSRIATASTTASSASRRRKFDLGMYAPGKRSKNVTFDHAGQVDLFCSLDASMAGYVLVLPHRFFVQPDAKGNFKLPGLPPGRYTVKAWHPRFGTVSSKIDVGRGRPPPPSSTQGPAPLNAVATAPHSVRHTPHRTGSLSLPPPRPPVIRRAGDRRLFDRQPAPNAGGTPIRPPGDSE